MPRSPCSAVISLKQTGSRGALQADNNAGVLPVLSVGKLLNNHMLRGKVPGGTYAAPATNRWRTKEELSCESVGLEEIHGDLGELQWGD